MKTLAEIEKKYDTVKYGLYNYIQNQFSIEMKNTMITEKWLKKYRFFLSLGVN